MKFVLIKKKACIGLTFGVYVRNWSSASAFKSNTFNSNNSKFIGTLKTKTYVTSV